MAVTFYTEHGTDRHRKQNYMIGLGRLHLHLGRRDDNPYQNLDDVAEDRTSCSASSVDEFDATDEEERVGTGQQGCT